MMGCKLLIEAPVNGGRNYNGPKVAKFLVGLIFFLLGDSIAVFLLFPHHY